MTHIQKKFFLIMLMCFLRLLVNAESNIEGNWKGIFVINGSVFESIEWEITEDTIEIVILNRHKENEVYKKSSYYLDKMQLTLLNEDLSSFNLLSIQAKKRLVIENSLGRYILYWNTENKVDSILKNIPYENSFEGNSALEGYSFSFTKLNEYTKFLVISQGDSLIAGFEIGHHVHKLSQILSFEVDDNMTINYLIFEEVTDNYVKGLLNGKTPFKLNKNNFKEVISQKKLVNNKIIQKKGREGLYELNLNSGSTILVGQAHFDLKANGTGLRYQLGYGKNRNTFVPEHIEWYLRNGKLLYVVYTDFHDGIGVFVIDEIEDNRWILKNYDLSISRYSK